MRRLVPALLLLGASLAFPASGQLQYFGYVGAADDDLSLGKTRGFTNFAHVSTRQSVTDPFVKDRVTAMAQKGLKATIDLGLVLWCDYDGTGRYRQLCWDWEQRWADWKAYNASILTSDKVLAFAILDEPFNRDAYMSQYEQAAARVKADFPWAKLWMVEGACVIASDDCGYNPGAGAFWRYQGSLPNIDWIGLSAYGIHPATDWGFQYARDVLRNRFPGRKWLYVMDGYYDEYLHANLWSVYNMGQIAREWYDVARADPNSVLLGAFLWPRLSPYAMGSSEFPCSVLAEHVLIGRGITGKARTQNSLPIGVLQSIAHGTGRATGWACDPDGTLCEMPRVDFYADGSYKTTAWYPSPDDYIVNPQCGPGIAYRFQQDLSSDWSNSGRRITAVANDLDSGSTTLPSNCPENPACVFYTTMFAPKGYMEAISPTGVAAGWACDPDSPLTSNKVRLVLEDGTPLGTYTTNLGSEQAVADECRGGYLHRFSVQLPSWARYRKVYAYSQDLVYGEKMIPWLCGGGTYCMWY